MASTISFSDANSGFQAGTINGHVSAEFHHHHTLDRQQARFINQGGKLGIQAGQYNSYGDTNVQILQDHDLINRLPYAYEAPFNSNAKQDEPICLPNTRVDLLQEIHQWADGQGEKSIFWLNGWAGTGKSAIARTVARHYFDKECLAASFFFSRGSGDVSHAGKLFTTIAKQLAERIPTLKQHVCDAIKDHGDIAKLSFYDQWRQLVLRPLSKLTVPSSYVLAIDALDECDNNDHIRTIIHSLAEARVLERIRLRVLLTSRPEIPIRLGLYQIPNAEHQDFVLHNISPSIVDRDITVFLEYHLTLIKHERSMNTAWPGDEAIRKMVQKASGLFIWAATACRFIREGKRFAARRLDKILMAGSDGVTEPEKHLDEIYTTVLKQSISPGYTEEEKEEAFDMLRYILSSIVILFSPLSVSSLGELIGVSTDDTDQTLADLHSVLDIPQDSNRQLRLHHPSFRDFLLDDNRCTNPNFWVDEKQAHKALADSCMRLMSDSLKQDVLGVEAPAILVADIEKGRVDQNLAPEVQYACRYWIQHLQRGCARLHDGDQVHHFLQKHLLHWLEALGWMGKVTEGVYAIILLDRLTVSAECRLLSELIHDVKRFVLFNRTVIEQAPLQIYSSALIFAPTTSIIRNQFRNCIPRWIQRLPEVDDNWSALLQTLEGHSSWVSSVAFSPDGKQLASGSEDNTIKLWDAGSGALLQTLEGHSDLVSSVAFSPDGKQLASGSDDDTIKLWDAGSGALLQTLKGHSSSVRSVAFSPDGKQLASGSDDETIKLWDAGSGALQQTLGGHSRWVYSVAFSPNGKQLASGSDDNTIKLWDAGSGALLQTLNVETLTTVISFSDDGMFLQTNRGCLRIQNWSASALVSQLDIQQSIFVGERWISCGTKRVLWLPPEYRPSSVAVYGSVVGLGYPSGRVSLIAFAF